MFVSSLPGWSGCVRCRCVAVYPHTEYYIYVYISTNLNLKPLCCRIFILFTSCVHILVLQYLIIFDILQCKAWVSITKKRRTSRKWRLFCFCFFLLGLVASSHGLGCACDCLPLPALKYIVNVLPAKEQTNIKTLKCTKKKCSVLPNHCSLSTCAFIARPVAHVSNVQAFQLQTCNYFIFNTKTRRQHVPPRHGAAYRTNFQLPKRQLPTGIRRWFEDEYK